METLITECKYIDVTNHCKERYVERVKGITNSFDIKNYVLTNNYRIVRDINKIFNYSEFLAEDRLGGDGTIKRFYVKDDILLVLRQDESVIITLIKIDYGFPKKINRGIVKELLEEINSLKENLQESEKVILSYINVRNSEKERISNKIKFLKEQIKEIDIDIEGKRKSINMLKPRINKYVNMIYNFMELRRDIEQLENIEEALRNIEADNSVIDANIRNLRLEEQEFLKEKYKYNKKDWQVGMKFNMSQGAVTKRRHRLIENIVNWDMWISAMN